MPIDKYEASVERHEWAAFNRRCKKDEELATWINASALVATAYQELISMFETWRIAAFGDSAQPITGRPGQIFPCTYQEWSGGIPFDVYGQTKWSGPGYPVEGNDPIYPTYGPQLRRFATAFRMAAKTAMIGFTIGSNINRTDNNTPGVGRNAFIG